MLIKHLTQLLDLRPQDYLLDLCCGNGLLTQRLAPACRRVVAIDMAPAMIAIAKEHFSAPNVTYLCGNVVDASTLVEGPFDKILLQFSFQYLDPKEAQLALASMKQLIRPSGKVLLGDVPELAKLDRFYPSLLDRTRYHYQRLRGNNPMGKFWSMEELSAIARPLGLRAVRLEQPTHFPYASYRMDVLLSPEE